MTDIVNTINNPDMKNQLYNIIYTNKALKQIAYISTNKYEPNKSWQSYYTHRHKTETWTHNIHAITHKPEKEFISTSYIVNKYKPEKEIISTFWKIFTNYIPEIEITSTQHSLCIHTNISLLITKLKKKMKKMSNTIITVIRCDIMLACNSK